MTDYERVTIAGDDTEVGGAPDGGFRDLSADELAKLSARAERAGLSIDEVRICDRDGFDLGLYRQMKGVRNSLDFAAVQAEREADQRARADADHQRRVAAHVKDSPRTA